MGMMRLGIWIGMIALALACGGGGGSSSAPQSNDQQLENAFVNATPKNQPTDLEPTQTSPVPETSPEPQPTDLEPTQTSPEPQPTNSEQYKSFTGTVRYIDLEGGFWVIVTDTDVKLDPTNLDEEFQIEGLKITGLYLELTDMVSFHMYGTIAELKNLSTLKDPISIEPINEISDNKNLSPEEELRQKSKKLANFDQVSSDPYTSWDLLEADLISAANLLIEGTIAREAALMEDRTLNPEDPYDQYHPIPTASFAETSVVQESLAIANSDSSPSQQTYNEAFDTNNQVQGVDELDRVKSDGSFIFLSHQDNLTIITHAGNVVQKIDFDGSLQGIHLTPTHVIIVVNIQGPNYAYNTVLFRYQRLLDGSLELLDQKQMGGSLITSRMIQRHLYAVSTLNLPSLDLNYFKVRYNLYRFDGLDADAYSLKAKALAPSIIVQWKNSVMDVLRNSSEIDISNVQKIRSPFNPVDNKDLPIDTHSFSALNMIHAMDIEKPLKEGTSQCIISNPLNQQSTYFDHEHLVLTYNCFAEKASEWTSTTGILIFKIDGLSIGTPVTAQVDGHPLNQFSMDIYNDHLRIATQKTGQWTWGDLWWDWTSSSTESMISTLKIGEEELTLAGQLTGIGYGEHLYSTRFIGDYAYAVTFLRIDPFHVIDLSDPANPTQLGELELPGFSTYLHPISDNAILGIGRGENGSVKVTLFDVSDKSHPVELSSYSLDSYSSQAIYDHHSFRYDPRYNELVIPSSRYGSIHFHVLRISTSIGIYPIAENIPHQVEESYSYYYNYTPHVLSHRSMWLDDQLITIGGRQVNSWDSGHVLNIVHSRDPFEHIWNVELEVEKY
jgi:uncharacterized secreted protein with C-terminal beta-propeller domain